MDNSKPKQKTLTSFFSASVKRELNTLGLPKGTKQDKSNVVSVDELAIGNSLNKNEQISEPSTSTNKEKETKWPDVWTEEMWTRKKETYPWIDCKEGKLGCKVCFEVTTMGAFKKEHVSLSHEWRTFQVSCYGSNRTNQLKSLRKKIIEHKQSKAHSTAQAIVESSHKNPITQLVDSANTAHMESTKPIFRSAYYIAKNDRPYNDYFGLLELQKLNGVDIGVGLHSRYSAVEIIDHISKEMKLRILNKVKEVSGKISIIIDESTSISSKSVLIIYLKCEISKEKSPNILFLDLVELPDQRAESVFNSTLKCLEQYGFDNGYLKQNLVSFTSDGASVMLGKHSGVAKRFSTLYPDIIVWHCLNHRLELASGDAVSEVAGVNHFQIFMDKLYSLYSASPKHKRELKDCAQELDIQMNKIGRVLSTRWVASSFRTVSAVWFGFQALANHFSKAINDPDRTSTEKSKYSGLLNRLTSQSFLLNLAFMFDILAELALLSESLENRNTSIVYADKLINRSVRYLEHLKEKPGTKVLEAQIAIKEGNFASVVLKTNPKIVSFNGQQLISSVINNLKQRMFVTTFDGEAQYEDLINSFKVLEPEYWPTCIPPSFGQTQVEQLCKRFKLNVNKAVSAYRDYLDNSRQVPDGLQELLNCTKIIPCSSADCERGFSCMNNMVTPSRNALTVAHVSSLMFIKIQGPPLQEWQPETYVTKWLRSHRSADDSRTRVAENPKKNAKKDAFWHLL
ncbi:E3 SUMO-protein ligase KIAA1586-like [Diabrotica virgifera virgifera]|uniref:HAT C-terminal dimerisation domain-containing protein n=1 Tax=Diabrotica virgifera virgifera TaxID=50390 RepID=A0ABM5K585_DIAVI|nr:E3 SUMO-protein ligase KIAA1586-like [Diabrotica virgifera virgifera]